MPAINEIKPEEGKRSIYDYEDQKDIKVCTNKAGRVVEVTGMHYEYYNQSQGLVPVGNSPNYITVIHPITLAEIKTTEYWFKENGAKFGYRLAKSKAGTERGLTRAQKKAAEKKAKEAAEAAAGNNSTSND